MTIETLPPVMILEPCHGWFDVYYGDMCIGSANNKDTALQQARDWFKKSNNNG